MPRRKPFNIAHRGGAGLEAENTIEAFTKGLESGADMIELDVQPTMDQKIVLFHDRDGLSRITGREGKVQDFTLSELKKLDAGSYFHNKSTDIRIPTLEEALDFFPEDFPLNVELKYCDQDDSWFESEVVQQLKGRDPGSIWIAARHVLNIERVQELWPEVLCILLQKQRGPDEYIKLLTDLGLKTAQGRRKWLSREFVEAFHRKGIDLFIFYSDDPEDMTKCLDTGIDGLLTNFPDRLTRVMNERFP